MAHEILLKNSHNPTSIVANTAHQQTSSVHHSPQGTHTHNGFKNSSPSSIGTKKWFPQPCQICGLNNHQAKGCLKRYNSNAITANATNVNASSKDWFPNTTTSHHMMPDLYALEIIEEYKMPDNVTIGNGHGLHIKNIGHTTLSCNNY